MLMGSRMELKIMKGKKYRTYLVNKTTTFDTRKNEVEEL